MRQQSFQHRSARVIALGRTLLAGFFLLAVWLDPPQPARSPEALYLILVAYAVFSIIHVALTWNDWWLERRLGGPAHALDLTVFAILVFLTDGFANPFFAFSVFIVLSATMRWSWREATLTAILVTLLFLVAGLVAASGAPDGDLESLILPGAHLIVLSSIIILFGLNQHASSSKVARLASVDPNVGGERPPIEAVLDYAQAQFPGAGLVLSWWDTEEPWTNVAIRSAGNVARHRVGAREVPFVVAPDLADAPFLFDSRRGRLLTLRGDKKVLESRGPPLNDIFAKQFAIRDGLRIPIRADPFEGELFVLGRKRLSSDDLEIGERVGTEISAAFARAAAFLATEEAAATNERLTFARDLHDSVVQSFAGIAMQLEGVRKSAELQESVAPQIERLQDGLHLEQKDLRRFINALRGGEGVSQLSDLSKHLALLAQRLARQWDIECELTTVPDAIEAPARLRQDIDLLIREAVANAVRHGQARKLSIVARAADRRLELEISDDGTGFPFRGSFTHAELKKAKIGPWSLQERISKKGGSLALHTGDEGACLNISLPFEGRIG